MQIDAAAVFVMSGVESHKGLLGNGRSSSRAYHSGKLRRGLYEYQANDTDALTKMKNKRLSRNRWVKDRAIQRVITFVFASVALVGATDAYAQDLGRTMIVGLHFGSSVGEITTDGLTQNRAGAQFKFPIGPLRAYPSASLHFDGSWEVTGLLTFDLARKGTVWYFGGGISRIEWNVGPSDLASNSGVFDVLVVGTGGQQGAIRPFFEIRISDGLRSAARGEPNPGVYLFVGINRALKGGQD